MELISENTVPLLIGFVGGLLGSYLAIATVMAYYHLKDRYNLWKKQP